MSYSPVPMPVTVHNTGKCEDDCRRSKTIALSVLGGIIGFMILLCCLYLMYKRWTYRRWLRDHSRPLHENPVAEEENRRRVAEANERVRQSQIAVLGPPPPANATSDPQVEEIVVTFHEEEPDLGSPLPVIASAPEVEGHGEGQPCRNYPPASAPELEGIAVKINEAEPGQG